MRPRGIASTIVKAIARAVLAPVAFFGLALARAAVLLVPFPRLSRRFGRSMGAVALVPLATRRQMRMASVLGRSIRSIAPRTPWESNCLAQAVLARALLEMLGIPHALHLGMRSASGGKNDPVAHAWVVSGRVFVTGGNGFANYSVVAVFVAHACAPEFPAAPSSSAAISGSRWRS